MNQTQENKATLSNGVPSRKSSNGTVNYGRREDQNGRAGGDPLLKRLRENKVALLTSEAMAQMGCSGFRARQKEVVSQACNLL